MGEDKQKDQFWSSFEGCLLAEGIAEESLKWYLGWARQFAKTMQGRPLRDHSSGQVCDFLAGLEGRRNIQPWQVQQASEALRILYQKHLHCGWADNWELVVPAKESSENVEVPHQDGASTTAEGGVGEAILSRLRSEVRLRQYSIRTEKAYLGWVRRFIEFHNGQDPSGLTHLPQFVVDNRPN